MNNVMINEQIEEEIFSICYENVDVQKRLEVFLPKKRAKLLAENCKLARDSCIRNHTEEYLWLQLDDIILSELENIRK